MQIAVVLYPGVTALDAVGPYEVFRFLPKADLRFVWHDTGPIVADSGVHAIGITHTLDETPDTALTPTGCGGRDCPLPPVGAALLPQVDQTSIGIEITGPQCERTAAAAERRADSAARTAAESGPTGLVLEAEAPQAASNAAVPVSQSQRQQTPPRQGVRRNQLW